jgi:DnaJ-domain-containing protein 1
MPVLNEDPRKTLGVSVDADEEEIRVAYLKKIKEYPPDRLPVEFERIRDAYQTLRDPRIRMRIMLQSADPEAPLASLLDGHMAERRFVGPEPWLAAIKERGA